MFIKKFNSLSRFRKRVKFFEAYFQTELNSLSHLFKKSSILWVTLHQKDFSSLSHIHEKRVQFFEWYFEIKGFKSLRHIQEIKRFNSKNISILCVGFTNSILWFFFYWWKNFESWKKGSISLNQKFSKKFKYLSHVKKKVQFFDVKKVQVFESWKKRRNSSLSQIEKKSSILWVIYSTKKFNPLSDIQEGFNSFNSLSFFFKKKNSILK